MDKRLLAVGRPWSVLVCGLTKWLFVAVLALVPVCARATVWSADDVPMVHLQDRNRYVCDPDGVLTQAMRDTADMYLQRLHADCGIQTVFVVAGRVKGGDTFRMAQDLGNHYGVGTKKDRRGLVVVVSIDDHRYTIAPGMGLEGDLTDVECDDIARACIVKNMKAGSPDRMVVETAQTLYQKFKTGRMPQSAASEEELDVSDWLTVVFVLLIFLGWPTWLLIRSLLVALGLMKKPAKTRQRRRRRDDDDWMPPFFFGGGSGFGGGGFRGGSSGGSFGGGSFGGGGSSGSW